MEPTWSHLLGLAQRPTLEMKNLLDYWPHECLSAHNYIKVSLHPHGPQPSRRVADRLFASTSQLFILSSLALLGQLNMVSPLPAGLKDSTMLPEIETEYLVVGAGPAGASLACFLGQNGEQASY